jgi:tetratricopeptide (TPR) repeat protein
MFAAAGAVVLVLAAGWLVWSNWRRFLPRAEPAPVAAPQASAVEEALRLHVAGDVEGAKARLRRIPNVSPEYQRAQKQLAEWEAATVEETPAAADVAAQQAERAALIERGQRLYEEREFLRAAKSLRAANQLAALDGSSAELFEETKRQLLPIAPQIDLFLQREWERALPMLWRQHLDDESNRDVERLLIDTLYNLAVEALREGDTGRALENLRDVVKLSPDDALAQRLLLFAERYPGTPHDLLYQILASQLEFRS